MARKSKYTPELVQTLTGVLASGATHKDACAYAGISTETFYQWINNKPEFSDAVTGAITQAHIRAVMAIKSAVQGQAEQVSTTTETVTETRLRKVKTPEGIVEQPYEYTKTVTGRTVTKLAPDWRAAVEYLKRRDSEHWSDRATIRHEDWRSQAIEDIKAGKLAFDALAAAFDDSLARELFKLAGVSVTVGDDDV